MDSNELLQALSNILDSKLDEKIKPINNRLDNMENKLDNMEKDIISLKNDVSNLQNDVREIKVVYLENNIIPRLQNIEACYTST